MDLLPTVQTLHGSIVIWITPEAASTGGALDGSEYFLVSE